MQSPVNAACTERTHRMHKPLKSRSGRKSSWQTLTPDQ
jgi:hypothetical protein